MSDLHKRNIHKGRYDFRELVKAVPELSDAVTKNPSGEETIDFADPRSVLLLNKALLKAYYNIDFWNIPEGSLCPPVPGRADYIHYAADLLGESAGEIPGGKKVHVLDIGTGANCIYPIIGSQIYGWKFTATDIDPLSLKVSRLIVESNQSLSGKVSFRRQSDKSSILHGVVKPRDRFYLTVCNPPFYASAADAAEANRRKGRNLGLPGRGSKSSRNFGGTDNELWFPGGERAFIGKMIDESRSFATQILWFTTLVSRSENLPELEKQLKKVPVAEKRIIPMGQGQKTSRILAWTFISPEERNKW